MVALFEKQVYVEDVTVFVLVYFNAALNYWSTIATTRFILPPQRDVNFSTFRRLSPIQKTRSGMTSAPASLLPILVLYNGISFDESTARSSLKEISYAQFQNS